MFSLEKSLSSTSSNRTSCRSLTSAHIDTCPNSTDSPGHNSYSSVDILPDWTQPDESQHQHCCTVEREGRQMRGRAMGDRECGCPGGIVRDGNDAIERRTRRLPGREQVGIVSSLGHSEFSRSCSAQKPDGADRRARHTHSSLK